MAEQLRKPERFDILRLKSELTGPIVVYVKCDFDDGRLRGFLKNLRNLNNSGEYSVFFGTYGGERINFLGTGSGPASLLTALFELEPSKLTALLRIGACGRLSNTTTNSILLSEGAFCADTVSATLAGTDRVDADEILVGGLASALGARGIGHSRGYVVSVNAMYLFDHDLRNAERKGASCWDLESATTLAFGKTARLPTASLLLTVSDKKRDSITTYPPIRRLDFVKAALNALTEH